MWSATAHGAAADARLVESIRDPFFGLIAGAPRTDTGFTATPTAETFDRKTFHLAAQHKIEYENSERA
jgi:hypothetical protein